LCSSVRFPQSWRRAGKRKAKGKRAKRDEGPDPDLTVWDATHQGIFDAMRGAGWPVNLVVLPDGTVLAQIHTCGLAHDYAVNRRIGRYSTNSPGVDKTESNAWVRPRKDGGLDVYRFGDAKETSDWDVTKNGYTHIVYHSLPEILITS
jgi:hypothetical protein